jgi:hypothetical protein
MVEFVFLTYLLHIHGRTIRQARNQRDEYSKESQNITSFLRNVEYIFTDYRLFIPEDRKLHILRVNIYFYYAYSVMYLCIVILNVVKMLLCSRINFPENHIWETLSKNIRPCYFYLALCQKWSYETVEATAIVLASVNACKAYFNSSTSAQRVLEIPNSTEYNYV